MTVQEIDAPDGRTWRVRVYRWRRPPWRRVSADFEDEIDWILFPILIPLYLVGTILGETVFPLLIFLFEAPATAVWGLVSDERYVEAVHEGPPYSRLSWLTTAEAAPAVADQVARQLALGYDRVQPHNAAFLGFG